MSARRFQLCLLTILAAVFLFGLPHAAPAHDIPSDVTVQVFVKPAGERLQLLLRVPLKALRDMDFPEQEGGYLDLERLAPLLPDAATLWIGNAVEIHEGKAPLPKPRLLASQVSLESDRSFGSFETALVHVNGPALPNSANVVWNQVLID
jgi:hypothetical protein